MSMILHKELRLMVNPEMGLVYGRNGKEVGAIQTTGYRRVGAWVNGRCVNRQAHRVVWEAVNGEIPEALFVNHINGDKADNRISNLELVTVSENNRHAYATGLASNKGIRHPYARLTENDVREIRRRYCANERGSLAAEFGINPKHLQRIAYGHSWSHMPMQAGDCAAPGPAKLTAEMVRQARTLYESGVSQSEIARRFGVRPSTICRAVRGQSWGRA